MGINKKQQNPTKSELVSKESGLTPLQEKAGGLLMAGKSYTQVANELQIDRSTLYAWEKKIPFQAYLNRLGKELQDEVKNSLISMYSNAVQAIRDSLDASTNPSIRLKAASWLVERVEQLQLGATDPREFLKEEATKDVWPELETKKFDEKEYLDLCKKYGIEP